MNDEIVQITKTLLDKNARGIQLTEAEVDVARKYFPDEYILNMCWAQLPEELENSNCFRTEKETYNLTRDMNESTLFVNPEHIFRSEDILRQRKNTESFNLSQESDKIVLPEP